MRKQVIFLMTDTTRKDMVGCYGYPKMKTPNLDRLAEEGIRYENAYTCQPVCGPARSAIFTGTFPHTNGMVTNSIALGDNVKTIGQRLYDHGIQCGYIGKWHLDGSDYFGNGRCPEGWDPEYWYDMKTYLNELTDEEKVKSRNPKECYKDDFSEEFTYAHRCSNRAIKYLEKHQNNDFFLSVSYDEPHGPSLCPKVLLEYLDFLESNKGKTSGSRVVFTNELHGNIMLHKPHSQKELKKYQIKQLKEFLEQEDLI